MRLRLKLSLFAVLLVVGVALAGETRFEGLNRLDMGLWNPLGNPGTLLNDTTLSAGASAAAGAGMSAQLVRPGTWTVANNLTLSVHLYIAPGGVLSVNSGRTLTINGTYTCVKGPCFAGAGSVRFGATSEQRVINAADFSGATAGARVQAAIASLTTIGGIVDATGFQNAPGATADPFGGVRNIDLRLGKAAWTTSATWRLTSGSTLQGVGWESTSLTAAPNFGDISVVANATNSPATDAARDRGMRVARLKIDGNQANNVPGTVFEHSHCVELNGVLDSVVEDVLCTNPEGDGVYISHAYPPTGISTENVQVRHNIIKDPYRNGIASVGGSRMTIHDNIIERGGLTCIDFEPDLSSTPAISNSAITDNIGVACGGVYVGATGGGIFVTAQLGSVEKVVVRGNLLDTLTGHGMLFRGAVHLTIQDNEIFSPSLTGISWVTGASIASDQVLIKQNRVYGAGQQCFVWSHTNPVTFEDNYARSCGSNAYQVDLSVGAIIRNNTAILSAAEGFLLQGVTKSHIIGNTSRNHTLRGIRLINSGGTNATNNTVSMNMAIDNASNGILESASSDGNQIIGNDVSGNGATGIVKVGANSVVRFNKGHVTESQVTATVAAGSTSVAVPHGLSVTPSAQHISCTPTGPKGSSTDWWVHSPTSTQVTVSVDIAPGGSGRAFSCQFMVP